ncbi:D-alanyl-D-alanine carboxypeptidase/D-alanyl-D-alanine endopeptidase [Actinoallomurus rhizosphaericola]|uniref:D-alanyl-D-alanine carboxypeptidase/D-alanyl-D-alanine endopeptidase n=1 Tax=Actinoallomurus rhizosphaericola TaxID=2952536 RepID=UPI002093952D|nr:D-alanyl-D-alanine carboxypeptidase/D-alanyl-D-alanine-endopeptidase [Actinoallomurus rhizosphaericola]MCO6000050.1 D-alanyl-D-alanine carboxypeptidase/D-alanyl-D-alanine-endopeptidase [Actinoallomurus rhizosphaericola]
MPRPERVVAMLTLALLNVFLVAAALAVVKLTPDRSLAVRPPTVAERTILTAAAPALSPTTASAPEPSSGSLTSRLDGLMGQSGMGANLSGTVIDVSTGRALYASNADRPAVPASTTKLVTSTAVLAAVGPEHRLTTKVVKGGGGVILVGGGDSSLTRSPGKNAYPRPASLTDLAKQTATSLKAAGTRSARVDWDVSLFQGKQMGPSWKANYIGEGDVSTVWALEVDEGRVAPTSHVRVQNPPRIAADAFVKLLRKQGISATLGSQTTAPQGAQQLGAVQSPPVSALVEQLLTNSDNDMAEAMARQVALARHRPASFAGGAAAVHEVLAGLGLANGIATVDGSGLSPDNRITPNGLARILVAAASPSHPELASIMSGMPIGGFSGTLAGRYRTGSSAAGLGVVRGKTGTLNGVNTLAGVVYDSDGRLLSFAFMANHVANPSAALAALDGLAGSLATCGCR